MAGAGYKLFNTGDVLLASEVNTYLMQQTVMVFANATARTSALSGVLAEGMVSYLADTNATEVYNGSAWVGITGDGDITGVTAGTGISGGGTSGTVTITNDMATTITAAGDIVIGTGNATYDNLPIGTTGQVLTADTTVSPYKVKWDTPAGSSGPAFRANRTANYGITLNTWTKINYDEEDFDTDADYDNTTNYRFTPGKAGYYQINFSGQINNATTGQIVTIALYKNGTAYTSPTAIDNTSQTYCQVSGSDLVYFNGTTDYVEVYIYSGSNGNIGGNAAGTVSVFSGVWIRS